MSDDSSQPLILQVVGFKNTGKTTLICKLVERFKADGRIVATVKHDAHDFEMDRPGTDTWQHQQAGADMTAIASPHRTAWLSRSPLTLEDMIMRMAGADVILIEGFKNAPYPKLVLLKKSEDLQLLELPNAIAAAVWDELCEPPAHLPVFRLSDTDAIYRHLLANKQ
jgi:molybdopterin-guanine dinucleotide biosynthesis adapter protein